MLKRIAVQGGEKGALRTDRCGACRRFHNLAGFGHTAPNQLKAGVPTTGLRSLAMMHKRIFGPELLIRTPVFLVQYNVWGDHKEGGSYVETELVAVEQERQSFRLWRNGEDGGRCLGRGGISARPATVSRTDLKGDC